MKKIYIIIAMLIVLLSTGTFAFADSNNIKTTQAKVTELLDGSGGVSSKVKVQIIAGKHKGETLIVDNLVNGNQDDKSTIESYNVHKGDELFLEYEEDSNGKISNAYIYDFIRYKQLFVVALVFIALLVIIGKAKGIKSLITLALTIVLIAKILIPIVIKGYNPEFPAIVICIVIVVINFLIVSGYTKKSLCAILGSSLGIAVSAALLFITENLIRFSSVSDEELQRLVEIFNGNTVNVNQLFFVCVMLASLGAIMDIGITIAATICEFKNSDNNITEAQLIKIGMNVGRDVMGTMTNTLIIAYVGSAFVTLLIMFSNNMTFIEFMNQSIITSELLKALIGGISIVLTIPFTAIITTKIINIPKKVS